jgi:transcriptional regulator with XRE-family HTH domain
MNLDWELFRANMRKRRLDLGLTQGQVAARMNRSQDFVSVLENNGRSVPNLTTIWLWAEALDGEVTIQWD